MVSLAMSAFICQKASVQALVHSMGPFLVGPPLLNYVSGTALLRCTANQVGTGHKHYFQPKNPAWAKLAAINNKNCYGTADVQCKKFGSVSYH